MHFKTFLSLISFSDKKFGSCVKIDLGNEEWANIVLNSIAIDKELRPDLIRQRFEIQGTKLVA